MLSMQKRKNSTPDPNTPTDYARVSADAFGPGASLAAQAQQCPNLRKVRAPSAFDNGNGAYFGNDGNGFAGGDDDDEQGFISSARDYVAQPRKSTSSRPNNLPTLQNVPRYPGAAASAPGSSNQSPMRANSSGIPSPNRPGMNAKQPSMSNISASAKSVNRARSQASMAQTYDDPPVIPQIPTAVEAPRRSSMTVEVEGPNWNEDEHVADFITPSASRSDLNGMSVHATPKSPTPRSDFRNGETDDQKRARVWEEAREKQNQRDRREYSEHKAAVAKETADEIRKHAEAAAQAEREAEEERKRRLAAIEAEERRRQAAIEAEERRRQAVIAEEKRRQQAAIEEEKRRKAYAIELARREAEEDARRQRLAAEQAAREAEEERRRMQAAYERVERERLAREAEAERLRQEERQRKEEIKARHEQELLRREQDQKRRDAEAAERARRMEEAKRRAEEAEQARIREAEAAKAARIKRLEEEEKARLRRLEEEEKARLKALEEAEKARIRAEEEARRLAIEAEKARLKAIEDAEKARIKAIEDAEKARLKAIEDAEKARLQAIEDEKKRLEKAKRDYLQAFVDGHAAVDREDEAWADRHRQQEKRRLDEVDRIQKAYKNAVERTEKQQEDLAKQQWLKRAAEASVAAAAVAAYEAAKKQRAEEEEQERKEIQEEIEAENKRIADIHEAQRKRVAEREEAERKRLFEIQEAERRRIAERDEAERRRIIEAQEAERRRIAELDAAEQKRVADQIEERRKEIERQRAEKSRQQVNLLDQMGLFPSSTTQGFPQRGPHGLPSELSAMTIQNGPERPVSPLMRFNDPNQRPEPLLALPSIGSLQLNTGFSDLYAPKSPEMQSSRALASLNSEILPPLSAEAKDEEPSMSPRIPQNLTIPQLPSFNFGFGDESKDKGEKDALGLGLQQLPSVAADLKKSPTSEIEPPRTLTELRPKRDSALFVDLQRFQSPEGLQQARSPPLQPQTRPLPAPSSGTTSPPPPAYSLPPLGSIPGQGMQGSRSLSGGSLQTAPGQAFQFPRPPAPGQVSQRPGSPSQYNQGMMGARPAFGSPAPQPNQMSPMSNGSQLPPQQGGFPRPPFPGQQGGLMQSPDRRSSAGPGVPGPPGSPGSQQWRPQQGGSPGSSGQQWRPSNQFGPRPPGTPPAYGGVRPQRSMTDFVSSAEMYQNMSVGGPGSGAGPQGASSGARPPGMPMQRPPIPQGMQGPGGRSLSGGPPGQMQGFQQRPPPPGFNGPGPYPPQGMQGPRPPFPPGQGVPGQRPPGPPGPLGMQMPPRPGMPGPISPTPGMTSPQVMSPALGAASSLGASDTGMRSPIPGAKDVAQPVQPLGAANINGRPPRPQPPAVNAPKSNAGLQQQAESKEKDKDKDKDKEKEKGRSWYKFGRKSNTTSSSKADDAKGAAQASADKDKQLDAQKQAATPLASGTPQPSPGAPTIELPWIPPVARPPRQPRVRPPIQPVEMPEELEPFLDEFPGWQAAQDVPGFSDTVAKLPPPPPPVEVPFGVSLEALAQAAAEAESEKDSAPPANGILTNKAEGDGAPAPAAAAATAAAAAASGVHFASQKTAPPIPNIKGPVLPPPRPPLPPTLRFTSALTNGARAPATSGRSGLNFAPAVRSPWDAGVSDSNPSVLAQISSFSSSVDTNDPCRPVSGVGWWSHGIGNPSLIKSAYRVMTIKEARMVTRKVEAEDGKIQLDWEDEVKYEDVWEEFEREVLVFELFEKLFSHASGDAIERLVMHLDCADVKNLRQVSRTVRLALDVQPEGKEAVLRRFLEPIGYKTWRADNFKKDKRASPDLSGPFPTHDPLPLTFADVEGFLLSTDLMVEFALVASNWLFSPHEVDPKIPRLARGSTRAFTRVLNRLRLQPTFKIPVYILHSINPRSGFVSPRSASPIQRQMSTFSSPAIGPGEGPRSPDFLSSPMMTPTMGSAMSNGGVGGGGTSIAPHSNITSPWRPGRVAQHRVWVPCHEGIWLSDEEIAKCERELFLARVWNYLKPGDIVTNTAMADQDNVGKLIFDGQYLRDLSFKFDAVGHLPSWQNFFLFPPGYYHNVIRSTNGAPVVYLDILPWREQIISSLRLTQDQVETVSPAGARYRIAKWLYRCAAQVKAGQIISDEGLQVVDSAWEGRLIFETEGTSEHAKDLVARCSGPTATPQARAKLLAAVLNGSTADGTASVEETALLKNPATRDAKGNVVKVYHPFAILREKSRPGLIWLRPIMDREKI